MREQSVMLERSNTVLFFRVGVMVRVLLCSSICIAQFLAILHIPYCADAEWAWTYGHAKLRG